MADIKSIAKKSLKSVEDKLKMMAKVVGRTFTTAEVNEEDFKRFIELKNKRDKLVRELELIGKQYDEARLKVVSQLPGNEEDVVDVTIHGYRIHKYPRNNSIGKFDEEKVLLLAKSKRILNKVAPLVRTINKNALFESILTGKITHEEYLSCTKKDLTPVVNVEVVDEFKACEFMNEHNHLLKAK
jgi:hypothetical protein